MRSLHLLLLLLPLLPLHHPFPLPYSLPVVRSELALSQPLFRSVLSSLVFFLCLSFSRFLSPFISFRRALRRASATPDSPTSPLRFFYILPTRSLPVALFLFSLSLSLFLPSEFLIIESRRDRERLARTWRMLALLSSAFSRRAIVPNLRRATLRSFYRTVDFDGFIRTLYSQSLYSRDLKSLIIGATSAVDQLRQEREL